jgi:hypothetical protein
MIAGRVPRGQPEIRWARIRMTSGRAAMGRSMKINNCAESVRSSAKAAPFARSIGRLATYGGSSPGRHFFTPSIAAVGQAILRFRRHSRAPCERGSAHSGSFAEDI